MAEVKLLSNTESSFSVIKNNFNLSDGSRVKAIGIAKNLNIESSEFSLKSLIDFDVQAEVLPVFTDGEMLEVIGLLKFNPHQNP